MFLSKEQIAESLKRIDSVHPFFGIAFLALKSAKIPIGTTKHVNFSVAADEVLEAHYKPTEAFDGYYQPLRTANRQERWLAKRYGSTSLQRITKDTFATALIHPPNTSDWGWVTDYVDVLKASLKKRLIPAFHLAVWLFRNMDFGRNPSPELVRDRLYKSYGITAAEQKALFDSTIPLVAQQVFRDKPINEYELFRITGFPPDFVPKEGVTLRRLELKETGPATLFRYQPSERLNLITGDNGLGKTFILECVWWALTGRWTEHPVLPRREARDPKLSYQLAIGQHPLPMTECHFVRQKLRWEDRPENMYVPGVVIFSRFDGSFAVLDPARIEPDMPEGTKPSTLLFNRSQIWHGLQDEGPYSKVRKLCNGLLEDWVLWQRGGKQYKEQHDALKASLQILSPNKDDNLILGEPMRLPGESREIPTLAMPYGEVPVIHASAGVQRIITLAYMLVWTWSEHVINSRNLGQSPQQRLVLLIDEVEAHLHPLWQRVLVPGIMEVVKRLWSDVSAQVHIGTHSPLVMASAESIFDESIDDLHHLKLERGRVRLGELKFVKRGTVDAWLTSEAFGLEFPRSVQAEEAIKDAKALLLSKKVDRKEVKRVHQMLSDALAEDDRFWPRWRFFAVKHGVDE